MVDILESLDVTGVDALRVPSTSQAPKMYSNHFNTLH